MGVGKSIKPHELNEFENKGYVAEPKYDGIFITLGKNGNKWEIQSVLINKDNIDEHSLDVYLSQMERQK